MKRYTVDIDALHKIFRTLDPVRIRILALLEREELAVQDLTQVLGLAQSTVSRHLGMLRDADLVEDRRAGTFSYYRFREPTDATASRAWSLARHVLSQDPLSTRDADALHDVLAARATRSRAFFDQVGPEWDALRQVFNDDAQRARAIARLVPSHLTVADIGTGTGVLAAELASLGMRVIAVDQSSEMLAAARAKLLADDLLARVDLRQGEISALPLDDREVDAALAHMVLHYVPSPADALAEMARVVRPGGRVVAVDFVPHDREWMRKQLGVLWQGFELADVRTWFERAGLRDVQVEVQRRRPGSGEVPATFIATGDAPGVGDTHGVAAPSRARPPQPSGSR